MNRPTRRMDLKGMRIIRANDFRGFKKRLRHTRSDAALPLPSILRATGS